MAVSLLLVIRLDHILFDDRNCLLCTASGLGWKTSYFLLDVDVALLILDGTVRQLCFNVVKQENYPVLKDGTISEVGDNKLIRITDDGAFEVMRNVRNKIDC